MSKDLIKALDILEEEKGISKDVVITALEAALVSAYKKNYGQSQNVEVEFDAKKGKMHVYAVKEVVEFVFDSTLEVTLEEALKVHKAYEIGDKIRYEVTPKDFGRIAAQTAKQVVMQRLRDAERLNIYNEYIAYENELLTGVVDRTDSRFVYVNLGKIVAGLSKSEQIPTETYADGERIKVLVSKVDNTTKGPQVFVSRTHPDLLKRLFEQEIPEIYDGIVEIVSIAREAGDRAKVAVRTRDENLDPVGTCVGQKGLRVQNIVNELNGENMDIVEWREDPAEYIANALNPAQVVKVEFDPTPNSNSCIVVVPDYQLSLAIGKRGQNARLAAKLTGYRIDIKSETAYQEYLDGLANKKEATEEAETPTEEVVVEAVVETELPVAEEVVEEAITEVVAEVAAEQVETETISE
ncbi:NusA antitermination factor [Granulicatella balaenopterae]|uniref:Transcription termination/antitermination protein NusA n=1 Tax=Granulicatella balaenopterae TaxID=137733 RepID=A0A1H9L5G0_9LACT|nr:transcription termination factor NusA [Granulicatella balaenopterae]SER06674.1 NusA antitermination factor [Granulicatella balaenopterae]